MPQIVAMTVGVTHNTHRKREREFAKWCLLGRNKYSSEDVGYKGCLSLLISKGDLTVLVGFTSRQSGIPHCKSTPPLLFFLLT